MLAHVYTCWYMLAQASTPRRAWDVLTLDLAKLAAQAFGCQGKEAKEAFKGKSAESTV